jgi:chorismate synthase
MKNTFGNSLTVTVIGESHGPAVSCVIDGISPGVKIDLNYINDCMAKRRPHGNISTSRVEQDRLNILSGVKNGYKFEIITNSPEALADELMTTLKHGVTEMKVHGMYTDTERSMLVCIINKRQIGEMMRIIKKYPDTFASFAKVNEVFGNFKRKV